MVSEDRDMSFSILHVVYAFETRLEDQFVHYTPLFQYSIRCNGLPAFTRDYSSKKLNSSTITMSGDAHKGGDLSDMAVSGTKIPNDAGTYEKLPSVPNPEQKAESQAYQHGLVGAGDVQGAADNPSSISDSGPGAGATGQVITGTGDQLPPGVESKRIDAQDATGPAAKGHARDGKALGDRGSAFDT